MIPSYPHPISLAHPISLLLSLSLPLYPTFAANVTAINVSPFTANSKVLGA